jgi:phosphoribosylamine--glycine ligase
VKRVLVIGGGGREHAIVRALKRSPQAPEVLAAPGNPGIAEDARTFADIGVDDVGALADLAEREDVDLTVVGPEAPLVAGVADAVRDAGIAVFGPSKEAAQLEGSKAFAKDVMNAAGVPTARARVCTDAAQAATALEEFGPPYVVKDDGLAAGKGVVVTSDRDEALAHAAACERVVIEEYLDGPEVSLFCVTDGVAVVPLVAAQDFKRIGDDDTGPNTGGMGAYAPLPWLPDGLADDIVRTVARPTIAEMARRGTPFAGLLYVGLAMTANGPRVIEFNARFGDPETQVVLALLDSPLSALLYAAATGALAELGPLSWHEGSAVTVVIAAAGYPGAPRIGDVIQGADRSDVIHAGTRRRDDGALVSSGGRVLSVTALGPTLERARTAAYASVAGVVLPGGQFRTDIARRASQPDGIELG